MLLLDNFHSLFDGQNVAVPNELVRFAAIPSFIVPKPNLDAFNSFGLKSVKVLNGFDSALFRLISLDSKDFVVEFSLVNKPHHAQH